MSGTTAERFREDLLEWSEDNQREFPWRDPDATLYEVLMSEFFLSRTRAQVVARVIPDFLDEFPNMEALRRADRDRIAEVIRPTGLQNRRAAALEEVAETLEDRDIPRSPDELRDLPRVGEYVANATLCFALGEPLYIQDTNVTRIYERLLGDDWPGDESEQAELLEALVPNGHARRYNLALLDFADALCSARSPQCADCFASEYCTYYSEEMRT
jgi:A/G-specific adenine glycosylase